MATDEQIERVENIKGVGWIGSKDAEALAAVLSELATLRELRDAVKPAWDQIAGFAVCVSDPTRDRFYISIDYPTLQKAHAAYSAIGEVSAALTKCQQPTRPATE